MGRVRIGTCAGPADAALVKAAFDAHRIPVLINAEQHASMLAGLGGALVPLHIFVDDTVAEDAAALLADLRAQDHDAATDEDREADAEIDRELAADGEERTARRRRHGVALLLVLAGAVTVPYVLDRPALAALVIAVCIGAIVMTLRGGGGPVIPRAQQVRPRK